jgi:class 3 adenylate cyclase/CHASE2 domain-containing sensor protein
MAEESDQKKKGRAWHVGLAQLWLALAVGFFVIVISAFGVLEKVELTTLDLRFVLRNYLFGPPTQMAKLATIDVDDRSVEIEGRFEDWDRTYHARVLDVASELGAKAIGVDFLLPEESTPMIRESQVRASAVATRHDVLALFQNPDYVFADVCWRHKNIYFAQYLTEAATRDYDKEMQSLAPRTVADEARFEMLKKFTFPMVAEFEKEFYAGINFWPPVDTLLATAKGVGQVQPIPDMDGIVRRNRALYIYDGEVFPTLSLIMVADYLGVPVDSIKLEPDLIILPNAQMPGELAKRDIHVPIDDKGAILINWAGDYRSTFRHFPYVSIMGFWKSYQLDRLSDGVKQEIKSDPTLPAKILGGAVDADVLATTLLLKQAGYGRINAVEEIEDIAAAMVFAPHVSKKRSYKSVLALAFPEGVKAPEHWEDVYRQLQANHAVADLLRTNPGIGTAETAVRSGLSPVAVQKAFGRIKPLANRTTGIVGPRQYPLWFVERTMDDIPVPSRDVLNARFAMTVKHHFRINNADLRSVISGILAPTPESNAWLANTTMNLIARSAGFPEQSYGSIPLNTAQAAMFEGFIADGKTLDDIVEVLFGIPQGSLDMLPEAVTTPLWDLYDRLSRNLSLSSMLTENPKMTIEQAADSLSTIYISEYMASDTTLSALMADSLGRIRVPDIEGDYYILSHLVEIHGKVPMSAHPLTFFTIVVDGKPVFVEDFQESVLFYGITSTGGHDRNPMPFEPRYPMVGMHLNLFNQIVTEQFLTRADEWMNWGIILVLALIMGLVIPKLSPTTGGAVMALIVIAYAVASMLIFARLGWWFDTIGPLGVVVFGYLGITVRNYIVEEKEKKFIKGAFASYLAPEVVDQIAENPEGLKLGGEPVEITAFFSDLQKFSAISQDLTATQLVELLNKYLTEMCEIIIKYDGTVDKFEGDAIVAFFGAPIRFADHATRACLSSIEMQYKLAELRPIYHDIWGHYLLQRIGLNSGECVVGNMGSSSRFDYTMMGDNVNLAARLEESAKQYGIYLQISEDTYRPSADHVEVRELDKTIVMGRSELVTVYELLDKKGDLDPMMAKVRDQYQEGLYIYREQRWADAIEKFKLAIEASGEGDNPSNTMIERCELLLSGKADVEIPADWDGAWRLTSK